jgi:integrase
MKITQAIVGKLTTKGKTDHIEWDDGLPGFGLRIREGGSRGYVVQYKVGQKTRRLTLGSAKTLTLDEARKRAKKELGRVASGEDPQAEKAKAQETATETFKVIAERFLQHQVGCAPSYLKATRRYLMGTKEKPNCRRLHSIKIENVTRREIAAILRDVSVKSGDVSADRARSALSAMFVWAMKEGITDSNPSISMNTYCKQKQRERVLDDSELAKIWGALPDNDYGKIVKLLIYTGARKSEIGSLRWSEVHDRTITLSGERTKNSKPFDLPLADAAFQLLTKTDDREFVFGRGEGGFGGWSKCKKELNAKLDLEPWVIHDIRRTVATGMGKSECRVQPHIVEACLNHISGFKSGVAGVYNKAAYADEKREAFEIWANHIAVILAQASGANVHQLRP